MGGWIAQRDDRWERQIDALDPATDAHAIVSVLFNHVFPLDIFVASELAQLRTFSVPTISRLLHATGRYEREGQRRVDDTKAILTEIVRPGPGTPDGDAMIAHLNRIHGAYRISNDDFLVTLAALVCDPVAHVDRYGWRPMRAAERAAWTTLWREVGERMGIEAIPQTYEDFVAWRDAYEDRAVRYAATNEAVARGLLVVLRGMLPAPVRPFAEGLVTLLLHDPHVVGALGLAPPSKPLRGVAVLALRARQHLLRRFDPWQERQFWDTRLFQHLPSYPDGYERLRLGPRVLREAARPAGHSPVGFASSDVR